MQKSDFWNDKANSEKVVTELNDIKKRLSDVENLKSKLETSLEFIELLKTDPNLELQEELEKEIPSLDKLISEVEISLLLNGPYDKCDCILDIHPGAGGTESCDWALMLYRMYTRWATNKNYKIEVVDYQDGDEAGIKSASMIIKGLNAYGYLKCEKGVHRLIRISPFDSNKRRHTSFASVDITPIYENEDYKINDNDIRIDIYRASGHGGQGVNTTDSEVRITHIQRKFVIHAQTERSIPRNRETALKV